MSKYKIIASEVVHGESDTGYQGAISSAIRHSHMQSNASCEVNIILFNMRFENGKFMISIQIIVNEVSPDLESEKQNDPSLDVRNKSMARALKAPKPMHKDQFSELHDLLDLTHDQNTLMAFNNHAIYDHLQTSLQNTWEIHPHSDAYKDIHTVLEKELDLNYKNMRIYTQAVEDISTIIPQNTGFTRHFVDFAMEHQHHDFIHELNEKLNQSYKPHNDNLSPKPKVATQWDE